MTWKEFYKTKRGIYMVSNDGKILNSITGTIYKNAKNSTGYCAIKINKKWRLLITKQKNKNHYLKMKKIFKAII